MACSFQLNTFVFKNIYRESDLYLKTDLYEARAVRMFSITRGSQNSKEVIQPSDGGSIRETE